MFLKGYLTINSWEKFLSGENSIRKVRLMTPGDLVEKAEGGSSVYLAVDAVLVHWSLESLHL